MKNQLTYKAMLCAMFVLLLCGSAMAHAIWIEAGNTGEVGKPQQVKVFFGEYSANERDTVQKWYSDINKLTLWVTQPGQRDVQLQVVDSIDFYAATFIPSFNGVYNIVVRHALKDLYSVYKLEYNAMATIWVGKTDGLATAAIADISLVTPTKNLRRKMPITLNVLFEGKVLPNQEVEIVSPTGNKSTVKANEKGEAIFIPTEHGRYLAEAIHKKHWYA